MGIIQIPLCSIFSGSLCKKLCLNFSQLIPIQSNIHNFAQLSHNINKTICFAIAQLKQPNFRFQKGLASRGTSPSIGGPALQIIVVLVVHGYRLPILRSWVRVGSNFAQHMLIQVVQLRNHQRSITISGTARTSHALMPPRRANPSLP